MGEVRGGKEREAEGDGRGETSCKEEDEWTANKKKMTDWEKRKKEEMKQKQIDKRVERK